MDDMVLKCLEYSGIEKKSEIDVDFFHCEYVQTSVF